MQNSTRYFAEPEDPAPDVRSSKIRREDLSAVEDSELLTMLHAGQDIAFEVLWQRHIGAALRAARIATSTFEPDDVAAEAFARALAALRGGGGPERAFRAYLLTTVRNVAATWGRQLMNYPMVDVEELDVLPSVELIDPLDRLSVSTAFRSLPERWKEALWYSEVEGMKPAELANVLKIRPTAAAMLTFRARQGLRRAWDTSTGLEGC